MDGDQTLQLGSTRPGSCSRTYEHVHKMVVASAFIRQWFCNLSSVTVSETTDASGRDTPPLPATATSVGVHHGTISSATMGTELFEWTRRCICRELLPTARFTPTPSVSQLVNDVEAWNQSLDVAETRSESGSDIVPRSPRNTAERRESTATVNSAVPSTITYRAWYYKIVGLAEELYSARPEAVSAPFLEVAEEALLTVLVEMRKVADAHGSQAQEASFRFAVMKQRELEREERRAQHSVGRPQSSQRLSATMERPLPLVAPMPPNDECLSLAGMTAADAQHLHTQHLQLLWNRRSSPPPPNSSVPSSRSHTTASVGDKQFVSSQPLPSLELHHSPLMPQVQSAIEFPSAHHHELQKPSDSINEILSWTAQQPRKDLVPIEESKQTSSVLASRPNSGALVVGANGAFIAEHYPLLPRGQSPTPAQLPSAYNAPTVSNTKTRRPISSAGFRVDATGGNGQRSNAILTTGEILRRRNAAPIVSRDVSGIHKQPSVDDGSVVFAKKWWKSSYCTGAASPSSHSPTRQLQGIQHRSVLRTPTHHPQPLKSGFVSSATESSVQVHRGRPSVPSLSIPKAPAAKGYYQMRRPTSSAGFFQRDQKQLQMF